MPSIVFNTVDQTPQATFGRNDAEVDGDKRQAFKALGLERKLTPTEITSMINYRRRIPNTPGEVYEESEE